MSTWDKGILFQVFDDDDVEERRPASRYDVAVENRTLKSYGPNMVQRLDAAERPLRPKEAISTTIFLILSIVSAVVAAVQPGRGIFMVLGLTLGGYLMAKHFGRDYTEGR